MSRDPTPEELGELIKQGKLTEQEANEIMARRVRKEAFSQFYGKTPPPLDPPKGKA